MAKNVLSEATLLAAIVVLVFAGLYDLRRHQIPNAVSATVAILYFAYAVSSGRSDAILGNVAFATAIFGVLLAGYRRRWMGGGDVKLLTAVFLWTGVHMSFPFSAFLLVAALLHVSAELSGVVETKIEGSVKGKIPFAPAVAAAFAATVIFDHMYHG